MGSETTAAAAGQVGTVRRDPMAMLPFCGYHMADYFGHWLQFGRELPHPPRIFSVNWFRKDAEGNYLWPGFGDNMRVLKWIVTRARGSAVGVESPLGWMPRYEDVDWRGLTDPGADGAGSGKGFSPERFAELMSIDREAWMREILSHDELFVTLYDRLPKELLFVRELIVSSLWRAPARWGLQVPQRPNGVPAAANE